MPNCKLLAQSVAKLKCGQTDGRTWRKLGFMVEVLKIIVTKNYFKRMITYSFRCGIIFDTTNALKALRSSHVQATDTRKSVNWIILRDFVRDTRAISLASLGTAVWLPLNIIH